MTIFYARMREFHIRDQKTQFRKFISIFKKESTYELGKSRKVELK